MSPELQLRDIHLPPEPSWWPPAPGWWLLALIVVVAGLVLARWLLRRWRAQRRQRALVAEFDALLAIADPAAQLAAISQLLRRAARLRDPAAATLSGDAWLAFLDQASATAVALAPEQRRMLLDGPYRRGIDAGAVQALIEPARRCYLHLVRAP